MPFRPYRPLRPIHSAIFSLAFSFLFSLALLAGCARGPARDTLAQWSTIDALLAGAYDGQVPCAEMLEHGDFGLGTFDRLDGEMIVLDGTVYQVRADGRVLTPPPAATTTPFAAVCSFRSEASVVLGPGFDLPAVEAAVNAAVPNENVFCAVRVRGHFARVKARSVPPQTKPYLPLAEAAKEQAVFEFEDVRGTLVGFRCPPFTAGVNVPGYHLHFLSDDRARGGHVLELEVGEDWAIADYDQLHRFLMILPDGGAALAGLDLTADRSQDLQAVER